MNCWWAVCNKQEHKIKHQKEDLKLLEQEILKRGNIDKLQNLLHVSCRNVEIRAA